MTRTGVPLRLLRSAPRALASWLLLVLGAVLLFAAQFALWAEDAVVDSDGFTDRAVRALDDEDVQRYVSTFLVEELIERGDPGLIAGRPLLEAAVQAVIGSPRSSSSTRRRFARRTARSSPTSRSCSSWSTPRSPSRSPWRASTRSSPRPCTRSTAP